MAEKRATRPDPASQSFLQESCERSARLAVVDRSSSMTLPPTSSSSASTTMAPTDYHRLPSNSPKDYEQVLRLASENPNLVNNDQSASMPPIPTVRSQDDDCPIDNAQLTYSSIRLPCDVEVMVAPDVLSQHPMVLRTLQVDLTQCLKVLPYSVHPLIKRTKIWVNLSYVYGTRGRQKCLKHSTFHHEEGWLVQCAKDRPDKARSIEIYNCSEYERMRLHWNGCGLLLHELCHLIHQMTLPKGLDNKVIKQLFLEATNSEMYDNVLRRDWAGMDEVSDLGYCMVDHKEFFSELSVAYLSRGYQYLSKADPSHMDECCPPLLHPVVTDRVTRQDYDNADENAKQTSYEASTMAPCFSLMPTCIYEPKQQLVDTDFQEKALARSCRGISHCNKFYPFTSGQLEHYDPYLYNAMTEIWKQIARWQDEEAVNGLIHRILVSCSR